MSTPGIVRADEARRNLRQAFAKIAARGVADHPRDEMAQSTSEIPQGSPYRQRMVIDRLTETERRIADLAAKGWTNDEIASYLYLSPKTIEWNLTKVYRSLGVRSRTQLAALWARATAGEPRANSGESPG